MNSNRKQFATLGGKLNVTGNNINYYRVQKGLSDKLIMLGLDIHRQAIFAIEAGKRSLTDYELCVIAEILGVTSNDLLKDFRERIKNELK